MKFKKGDKVRIVKLISYMGGGVMEPNYEWKLAMGKTHTIKGKTNDKEFPYALEGMICYFCNEELRLVDSRDPLFSVGEKVKIRDDLRIDKSYGYGINACTCFGTMINQSGKEVEIKFIENKTYRVHDTQGRGWWINEQMISKK